MHSLLRAVHSNSNSPYVGIPDSIGSSMRMADVIAEMSALAADITLRHLNTSLHILSILETATFV